MGSWLPVQVPFSRWRVEREVQEPPEVRPPLGRVLPVSRAGVSPVPLEEKIGQMLLVGFRGNYLDNANPIVDAISNLHIGGVILFDSPDPSIGNIGSPRATAVSYRLLAGTRPDPPLYRCR